jgi:hypothetical protein
VVSWKSEEGFQLIDLCSFVSCMSEDVINDGIVHSISGGSHDCCNILVNLRESSYLSELVRRGERTNQISRCSKKAMGCPIDLVDWKASLVKVWFQLNELIKTAHTPWPRPRI